MSWNYRVMRHVSPAIPHGRDFEEEWFAIHEVYYDDDGKPNGHTQEPIAPYGDTVEELITVIERMLTAAKASRISGDVLEFEL